MSQNIVLKKGLNIPISGESELRVSKAIAPSVVALRPTDFKGFLPRLLVREGDSVLCGSPVMADKKNPDILLCSPVSGTVKSLVRGEKRKLLAVLIEADCEQKSVDFGVKNVDSMTAEEVKEALCQSGLWPFIVQRPYGIIANPSISPRDIYVSAFSTSPLAADYNFCFASELKAIAFLYKNDASETNTTPSAAAVSIADIEKRSGFVFFRNLRPEIADEVKAQKNLKDWGL